MKVTPLDLPDVLAIELDVFGDQRGFFFEGYSREAYCQSGVDAQFVQDNISRSVRGTLRGLHLQHPHGQGKLVNVVVGEVFDVAVDVRRGSPTFGRWAGATLSAENHLQLYIPPGFAHGFSVVSEAAVFWYKCTDYYHPEAELGVAWDDPDLGIAWPEITPLLSPKDLKHPRLRDIPADQLPPYPGQG
jgi:dTDP-4-dehydrorhamnose 3,5-epimerase